MTRSEIHPASSRKTMLKKIPVVLKVVTGSANGNELGSERIASIANKKKYEPTMPRPRPASNAMNPISRLS